MAYKCAPEVERVTGRLQWRVRSSGVRIGEASIGELLFRLAIWLEKNDAWEDVFLVGVGASVIILASEWFI